MFEKKSFNYFLISLLTISIILVGVFGNQWWQTKNELIKQAKEGENLLKQLMEAKKEIKEGLFQQCNRIGIVKEKGMTISLRGVYQWKNADITEGKSIWDIIVVDPEGLVVGNQIQEVPGMYYSIGPGEKEKELDIGIRIHEIKTGDYLIIIMPGRDVSPTNTYTLEFGDLILAENNLYTTNFLDRLYILRQTETEIIPIVPASVGCRF